MESVNGDLGNPRFFDFKKRPYDAVNPRLTFQFWPAFQSELRRKGLSNVLDLQFNPFPTEPSAALRRIKHDDQLAKTRLLKYETDYDDYLLAGGTEPSLDLLRLAPEIERVATEHDRKEVRFFKDLMEKHATSANTALGIFNTLTTKSVQTDLSHILDDPRIHPRNKVFQLQKFFKDITPPNVAIAEQIKVEVANIPLALTYEDALRVANQIRDLQAELELVNPAATLTLSEMVSKLVSKIRDPKFQMLRFQISEWEERRLSPLATVTSTFGTLLSSAMAASTASVSSLLSGAGGGGASSSSRSSSSSSGTAAVAPVVPAVVAPIPIIVQFRPLIDLIQKFRLSESTIESNYSINSVDVIINGGNAGAPIPHPVHHPSGRPDFFTPPPHPSGQFVWVPKDSYVKPFGGNGGNARQGARSNKSDRGSDRNRDPGNGRDRNSRGDSHGKRGFTETRPDRNSRGDKSSRGDKDSSKRDRDYRPRGDSAKSTSEGGDRKRDRPSSSRDHQAASMTVASEDDDEDDSDESSSSDGSKN